MLKSKIAKIVSILFNIMLICGFVCLFFIPKLYDFFSIEAPKFHEQTILYRIAFYLCYLICLGIIFELRVIFNQIYNDTPFKKSIENALKLIAILFMILSIIIMVKTIFIPTPLSLAAIIVTFIISLCFYVLSQIFKVAIAYKNEIDFTV